MNGKIAGIIALVLIAGGGVFYGGMAYAQMSRSGPGGNFANLSAEDRARFSANGGPTGMRGQTGTAGGGFTAGEVIVRDDSGMTVKMQDGSTKIILVGSSAQIMKSAAGSVGDLTVGAQVTVTGLTNSDGSVTAQSVQIRPAGSMPIGESVNQ